MASKALPGNRCRSGGADSNLRPRLLKFPASDAERARKGQRAHPNPLSSFPPANWAPGEISKKSGHASMSCSSKSAHRATRYVYNPQSTGRMTRPSWESEHQPLLPDGCFGIIALRIRKRIQRGCMFPRGRAVQSNKKTRTACKWRLWSSLSI